MINEIIQNAKEKHISVKEVKFNKHQHKMSPLIANGIWQSINIDYCICINRVLTPLPWLNSLPFPDILTCIPYQFCMKFCVKSSHINIEYCLYELIMRYFSTFASMKFPTFPWLIYPFPNCCDFVSQFPTFPWLIYPFPNCSWLCQPVP